MNMALLFRRRRVALLLMVINQGSGKSISNYYPSYLGMRDPNVDKKMYWANAIDLLDDLSVFDALYVTHHNCAWSAYEKGCGADVEDDELWYMGLSPCFRANAAFSLYGILKGERDRGCNRKTFINSFMTSNGIESFTSAMVDAGESFTSSYSSSSSNGYPGGVSASCTVVVGEGQGNDEGGGGGTAKLNEYYDSYGISCSSSGEYLSSFFKGAFCSDMKVIGTKDSLDTFNDEISKIQCVPIYKASDQGQRNLGSHDGSGDDEEEDTISIQSPLSLLLTSQTCSIADHPRSCPDPFAEVRVYEKALALSTGQRHNKRKERTRVGISCLLLLFGLMALAIPLVLVRRRRRKRKLGEIPEGDEKHLLKRTLWQRVMSSTRKKLRIITQGVGGSPGSSSHAPSDRSTDQNGQAIVME